MAIVFCRLGRQRLICFREQRAKVMPQGTFSCCKRQFTLCLHDLGHCCEGAIPRSLLRIQVMMPRSLLRGISLRHLQNLDDIFLVQGLEEADMSAAEGDTVFS